MIHHADNAETFQELTKGEFVLVDFYSTTCGPCRILSRILEDLEAEIPFLDIVKVNITDCPALADTYQISAVPVIHFYKDGELVWSHLGVMQADQIKEVISEYMYS